jgi:hypothetical protein
MSARHAEVVEVGGAAEVAVVEADDAEAAVGEQTAEAVEPGDHLSRQAHHEDQWLPVRLAHLLVTELDPVRSRNLLFTK